MKTMKKRVLNYERQKVGRLNTIQEGKRKVKSNKEKNVQKSTGHI